MATFDLNTFLKLKGGDQRSAVKALGMQFGMPSCLLNFIENDLMLIPTSVLGQISVLATAGADKADEITKEIFKRLMLNTGIAQFDTEQGLIKFVSDTSQWGLDVDESSLLSNLGALHGIFEYASSFGSEIYKNYSNTLNQVNAMKDCIEKFKDNQEYSRSSSAIKRAELAENDPNAFDSLVDENFSGDAARVQTSIDFINKALALKTACDKVFAARANDPSLEPVFVDNTILDLSDFIQASDIADGITEPDSVFRLVFGPPRSKKGQFILSVDGLYYDAQSGGISPIDSYIVGTDSTLLEDRYKFEHEPFLGGKGVQISKANLTGYLSDIFDPAKIDESVDLQNYYDEDHFLQQLLGQKNKEVLDLSGQITYYLQFSENSENDAIIINLREALLATIAKNNEVIRKRKKQIEVAIRTAELAKRTLFLPGQVPINDFSYLTGLNLSIELKKQKALVLKTTDIEGIIKPINPKFVISPEPDTDISLSHLIIPPIGKGGIIYSTSSVASGTAPMVLSLNDQITTDGLIAIYNFLEATTVDPSSTDFTVLNCAGDVFGGQPNKVFNNAKLIGNDPSSVFTSGLAIPYFKGLVGFGVSSTTAAYPSGIGTAMILPDDPPFRNLTYSTFGWSFDCWIHVPTLEDSDVGWGNNSTQLSSLHRIILSCENVGETEVSTADINRIAPKFGSDVVRGMVMGFTRDRRIVSNNDPNDVEADNAVNATNLTFYLAPTQSFNGSSCTFVASSTYCASSPGWYSIKGRATSGPPTGTSSLADCSAGFVHLAVAMSPSKDEVKIWVDGKEWITSSMQASMGTPKNKAFGVPSFALSSSFEYGETNKLIGSGINSFAKVFEGGPKLNKGSNYVFTPWVVGGGYTDGIGVYYDKLEQSYFMGPSGGKKSGLEGFLGSIKFYAKSLSTEEVIRNFTSQKGFFKNIIT